MEKLTPLMGKLYILTYHKNKSNCGCLNGYDLHRTVESGTIMRYSLVGVGAVFIEETDH